MMSRKLLVLVAGLMLAGTLPIHAGEQALDRAFSDGLRAYYAQDYVQAYNSFDAVIAAAQKEPQADQELFYYYRGLSCLHLGRTEAAKADFQKGADLETNSSGSRYNVARLLERIQGPDRLILEQYRATARLAAMQKNEALRRQRYEQNKAAQDQVLSSASETSSTGKADGFRVGPLPQPKVEEAAAPVAEQQPAATAAADADPFATPADEVAAKKPAAKAATKPAAKAADDDSDDPFAAPVAKPAAKKTPAAKTPTAAVDDSDSDSE